MFTKNIIRGGRVMELSKMKKIREIKGVTQKEIADRIGVSRKTIMRTEKNEHEVTLENASAIADCMGVSIEELCGKNISEQRNEYVPDEINWMTYTFIETEWNKIYNDKSDVYKKIGKSTYANMKYTRLDVAQLIEPFGMTYDMFIGDVKLSEKIKKNRLYKILNKEHNFKKYEFREMSMGMRLVLGCKMLLSVIVGAIAYILAEGNELVHEGLCCANSMILFAFYALSMMLFSDYFYIYREKNKFYYIMDYILKIGSYCFAFLGIIFFSLSIFLLVISIF